MNVPCPTCGAALSFRFDDSFVRVCSHCKSAVARSDRGAETLGQFADPVRINSPLRLFSDGYWGEQSFVLIGMGQLQHEAGGVWQEWYAKLGGGVWGWLTEAQGRLYMTFERRDVSSPPWDELYPNASMTIDGKPFYVVERGTATYVSAMGEIPYRLVPKSNFYFVDLSDGEGGFATIDLNDGSETPTVYVGQQISVEQLRITGGEAGALTTAARGGALKCPDCSGPLEIRAPETLSVACSYCGDLIDVSHGTLSIIAPQGRKPVSYEIPLGSEGTFSEGKLTVIGFVARSAYIDGGWYPYEEYLLHSPAIGFRWLQSSDNHWSYIQPVAGGAVAMRGFNLPTYDGVKFAPFQQSTSRVDYVIGELYWKASVGESVKVEDFIAPPAMLSREQTENEQNWSLASYMTPEEVKRAFGSDMPLHPPIGVAPNQPYSGHVGKVIAVFSVALFAVGFTKCMRSSDTVMHRETISIPSGPAPQPTATPAKPNPTVPPSGHDGPPSERPPGDPLADVLPPAPAPAPTPAPTGASAPTEPVGHIRFSKPFSLEDKNIEIDLTATLQNNWAYIAVDLVNDKTGTFVSLDKSLEYYSGIEDGESWSEGSPADSQVLAPLGAGQYVLRIESQQGGTFPVTAEVQVKQGVFRARWLFLALGILFIPYGLVLWHAHSFKKRRMETSNLS